MKHYSNVSLHVAITDCVGDMHSEWRSTKVDVTGSMTTNFCERWNRTASTRRLWTRNSSHSNFTRPTRKCYHFRSHWHIATLRWHYSMSHSISRIVTHSDIIQLYRSSFEHAGLIYCYNHLCAFCMDRFPWFQREWKKLFVLFHFQFNFSFKKVLYHSLSLSSDMNLSLLICSDNITALSLSERH